MYKLCRLCYINGNETGTIPYVYSNKYIEYSLALLCKDVNFQVRHIVLQNDIGYLLCMQGTYHDQFENTPVFIESLYAVDHYCLSFLFIAS